MQESVRRVLLIDDTEADRVRTRFLLERRREPRYMIEEVSRGAAAVSACERVQPDIVLLDYWLPDRDGLEVLAELRDRFGPYQFAIVLLTGSGHELLAVQSMKAGAQDYVPKNGLTEASLERAIHNALDKLALERDRQRAIKALEENERKLRDIVDSAPCALYTIDMAEGRTLYVSGFVENLLGYSPAEVDALPPAAVLALIHPDDRASVQNHVQSLRQAPTGEVLECEFRIRSKPGDWRWLVVRDRVVTRDPRGLPAVVSGAASDVTHRKIMEAQLMESEAQLMVAQDAAGIGTWAWDLDEPALNTSSLFMQLYGRGHETAERRQVWEEWVHPDDRHRVAGDLSKGLAGAPFATEYRTIWPDGSLHWLRSQGSLSRDAHGRKRLLGATLDITEKKRFEEDLKRSNYDLERFAYIASHDLQEPLRTISSFSELLARRNQSLDAESRQYLEFIKQGGQRMQTLISDLLTFSRVTQAEQDPLEEVDCNEVLEDSLHALHLALVESGGEVKADPLPTLEGNFQQLTQLFQNLIGNAIKYRGLHAPQIRLSAQPAPRGWQFCVSDNGIGFDMAFSHQIFEAFKRLHTRDEYAGTGIGLAICKRIVERHGGRIWAESEKGVGSRFFFTLARMTRVHAAGAS